MVERAALGANEETRLPKKPGLSNTREGPKRPAVADPSAWPVLLDAGESIGSTDGTNGCFESHENRTAASAVLP